MQSYPRAPGHVWPGPCMAWVASLLGLWALGYLLFGGGCVILNLPSSSLAWLAFVVGLFT